MLKFIFLGVDGQSLRLRGVLPSIDGYLKKKYRSRLCFYFVALQKFSRNLSYVFFYLVALIKFFKNSFKAFFLVLFSALSH